jgi:hypothetical protein
MDRLIKISCFWVGRLAARVVVADVSTLEETKEKMRYRWQNLMKAY